MTNDDIKELAMKEWTRQVKAKHPLAKLRRAMVAQDRELKREFKKHQRRIQGEYAAKKRKINERQRELQAEAERRRWSWLAEKARGPLHPQG